jgi:SAM-dependent methyltransferase
MDGVAMPEKPTDSGGLSSDPAEQVRAGYDVVSRRYAAYRDQFKNDRYLERFVEIMPPPRRVIDVGCGSGQPVDGYLVERGYDVTGLDISPKQIELARGLVPKAHYEVRNMLELQDGEFEVDGLVSFYAVFHAPRKQHAGLLRTFASFLRPRGVMLITLGTHEWEGIEDFHGADLYWSHFGRDTNRKLVEDAGFDIVADEIDESGGEQHQVVIARKRTGLGAHALHGGALMAQS